MKIKHNKIDSKTIGPFKSWEDVPEATLMAIVDPGHCNDGTVVYKPDCVDLFVELGGDFSGWSQPIPPSFKFQILPDDFEIIICQK